MGGLRRVYTIHSCYLINILSNKAHWFLSYYNCYYIKKCEVFLSCVILLIIHNLINKAVCI